MCSSDLSISLFIPPSLSSPLHISPHPSISFLIPPSLSSSLHLSPHPSISLLIPPSLSSSLSSNPNPPSLFSNPNLNPPSLSSNPNPPSLSHLTDKSSRWEDPSGRGGGVLGDGSHGNGSGSNIPSLLSMATRSHMDITTPPLPQVGVCVWGGEGGGGRERKSQTAVVML